MKGKQKLKSNQNEQPELIKDASQNKAVEMMIKNSSEKQNCK